MSVLQESFEGATPWSALSLNNANDWAGMQWTTESAYAIESVTLKLGKGSGDNVGNVTVEVFAVDGSGHPTGDALATIVLADGDIPESPVQHISCVFETPAVLADATKYVYTIKASGADASNVLYVTYDDAGYGGGMLITSDDGGSSWDDNPTFDMLFRIYSLQPAPFYYSTFLMGQV